MTACFVCGNVRFSIIRSADYSKCDQCGHELKKSKITDPLIVNDKLSFDDIKNFTLLERFKLGVIKKTARTFDLLVDIGSSSGKFLFYAKKLFKEHLGVEITPESVAFSRDKLKLEINYSVDSIGERKVSVATFWHTLEHIPVEALDHILKVLQRASTKNTRVIITVPNADSILYYLFGRHFTYYDAASHVHQFSKASLDTMLLKYGFEPESMFFSFIYSFFGYLQSFLNLTNQRQNWLYFYLKRERDFGDSKLVLLLLLVYNIILAGLLLVPSLFGVMLDFLSKKRGVVLTVCYYQKKSML